MEPTTQAFCQTTITSINPSTMKVGHPPTSSIQVYGTNFADPQSIWVDCTQLPQPLEIETDTNGKNYVDIPPKTFTSDQFKTARSIPITPTACTKDVPPANAQMITVVANPAFSETAPAVEALLGVVVSAASSTNPGAEFLGLGVADIGIGSGYPNILNTKAGQVWLSGQLGLKGMAQPGAVSGAASSGYYASAANATPDKIVQSFDASLHLGVQLHSKWTLPSTLNTGTSTAGDDESNYLTLSFIAGGGAVTPLSVSQSSPQVFEATPLILQNETPYLVSPTTSFAPSCFANPTQTPTCYVIFTPSDRTHFYRSYDAGFRLKLYGKDFTDKMLRFPGIIDLTVGQNEYVTGGQLHGTVLHVAGSGPIPQIDGFYIFGSMDMGLSTQNGGGPQLQLIPAPITTGLTAASPGVYTILTKQPNRDRYMFGFGLDVIHLISSMSSKNKNSTSP